MRTVETGQRIAIKNVLFATDFSPCSNAALPHALSVARRFGATVHATHVRPTEAEMLLTSPEGWSAAAVADDNRRAQEQVDELERQFQGMPHEVLMPRGKIADTLAQIVEERQIDLLVLGTHGRSGVGKLLLGSVAEEIFRRAACPVLSVGPHVPRKLDGKSRLQHIVFATDFSEDSLAALPYAVSLAEEDQAQLALLHVVEQPEAGIADFDIVRTSLSRRLQAMVPPAAEISRRAECRVEFGRQFAPPAQRILEIAHSVTADLIVLGVRPVRSKLHLITHRASTAAQILTQAACPVLTVCARASHTTSVAVPEALGA